ncbi:MAG: P-II family nitrogen regulator [Geminicoccaceae bacterium]|jgi:nitrogen regulatory protein PII
MKFKLIVALVNDEETDLVLKTAREAGATGSTVITSGRGEGLTPAKTFFGLDLESQRDLILLLVEGHLSREILERIAEAGKFEHPGTGVAFQIDIEDAVGLQSQIEKISSEIEEKI